MNQKDIDNIAYLLKHAKENNKPKPIVFLGAGASASAGIPLTGKIIADILDRFKNNPNIKKLNDSDKKDYYKVMGSLETFERHDLLRSYIEDPEVKINVTHIYLAQMLKEGYVDYVVTVNFDDLLLKACALYNFIPAVYDIAILKDFTTTTLQKKSVTYLHGQYHGLWLLNTPDELKKVKEEGNDSISNVFRQICNERTWIVAGYSGEDGILDKIAKLGRFDNNLFWVGYKMNEPSKNVQDNLLNKPNSNSYWISGYDSDSFFLKLHSELNLETPEIFNKPFSFLNNVVNNIKDIENQTNSNKEHKELFRKVEERFATSKKWINDSIKRYENQSAEDTLLNQSQINKDDLKQEILEAIVKNQFDKIEELNQKAILFAPELNKNMSDLYFNYALAMHNKKNYDKAIELNLKSIELNECSEAYYNIGVIYSIKKEFEKAINYYNKSLNLNEDEEAYNSLGEIYEIKSEYEKAENYYKKAIEIDDSFYVAISNLGDIYEKKKDTKMAIEFYKKAIGIKPDYWRALLGLANIHSEMNENDEAIKYFQKALKSEESNSHIHNDYGFFLLKTGDVSQAETILQKAIELGDKFAYMNIGHVYLINKNEELAIQQYKTCLSEIEKKDEFWDGMYEDEIHLNQYGIASEYYQSILKKIKQET